LNRRGWLHFPTGTTDCFLCSSVPSESGTQTTFYPVGTRLYSHDKAAGAWS